MRIAHSIYIAFFALMVVVGNYFSVLTLKNYDFKTSQDVLRGKAAVQLEDYYNQNFIVKGVGTNIWALINYTLFNEGRPGVIIGNSGWLFTQEEFKDGEFADIGLSKNLRQVQRVQHILQQHNVSLMMVVVPAKADIYSEFVGVHRRPPVQKSAYTSALAYFEQNGIPAPNLKQSLLAAKKDQTLFLKSDTHWTVAGAQVAAETLAKTIEQSHFLTNTHSKNFTLVTSGSKAYQGDLLNFIPLGPFARWITVSEDQLQQTTTELSGNQNAVNSNDLFADESMELVLVGTSYSANRTWNFAGALSHYLGTELLNVAQEGKGPFTPMADYLKSPAFKETPPRLVVWEIPERFLPASYDHTELNKIVSQLD